MSSQAENPGDLKVFISSRESKCDDCGEDLGPHAWIFLAGEKGALCLSCADLDHLIFLPSGDAALTRRAKKHSTLSAVVLKWSKARKRYERQGLLVEAEALASAEQECLSDHDARQRRAERAAVVAAESDREYVKQFAARVRELFPRAPAGREEEIAEHACLKYSGRVGRSAFAKGLDEKAIRLGVIADIRHRETRYDALLAMGYGRGAARMEVVERMNQVLESWERSPGA